MSSKDRRPYLTSTAITQTFLDNCADNLSNQLELACDIETPTGVLRVSDRHKYVGGHFYEALVKFPVIERTVGEWLSNELEFSTLTIELSNVDGRFNNLLPGGNDFGSWVGKQVTVRLGLRDVDATYRTIFRGRVTDIGGFKRGVKSITIIARERFDSLKAPFPAAVFSSAVYPNIENNYDGTIIPIVYGDWTTNLADAGGVVGFPINGNDANVYGGSRSDVSIVVSANVLVSLDSSTIFIKRSSDAYPLAPADVVSVAANKNSFTVRQNGATRIDGEPWLFSTGDQFIVRVRGENIDGGDDNPLAQARHILKAFGGATSDEFSSRWISYEGRAALPKSRAWVREQATAIEYAASLLEQVRMEPFVNSDQKLDVLSVWFEDAIAAPSYMVRNWDLELGSLSLAIDDRNNFNRAQGAFGYNPPTEENAFLTPMYINSAAIAQVGKKISKQISFPNLYIASEVATQTQEMLKLASSSLELVSGSLTWRSLLLDVGGWVRLNLRFSNVELLDVPCLVRSIGYDPQGIKIPFLAWSFQQTPFPGWSGRGGGIVGGYNATITVE